MKNMGALYSHKANQINWQIRRKFLKDSMRSGAKSRGLHFKAKLPHTITIMLGIFNSYLPESLSLVYREEREREL